MSSKLNIYSIILTLVLSFVTTNHLLLKQYTNTPSLSKIKTSEQSDCCQPITDCCDNLNPELAKCLSCHINDKQPNQIKSIKFKIQLGKLFNLTTSIETQNKPQNYLNKDAFFIQQNNFNKDYQLDRPMSYSYLENIHTILLLI